MLEKLNIIFIILLIFFSLFNDLYSQRTLKEIELISDAAAGGLGEAVAGKRGLHYFLYNPSSISKINDIKIILNHYEWMFDNKTESIKFVIPLKKNKVALGGGVTGNYYLDFMEYTENAVTDLNYHCLMGCIGIASEVISFNRDKYKLSAGINIKMVNYRLATESIDTALLDIGFLLDTKLLKLNNLKRRNDNNLSIGLSIQNLWLNYEGNSMPLIVRTGINYKLFDYLSLSSDFIIKDKAYINTGMEYFFKNMIYIRAGYKFLHDSTWLTGGMGVRYGVGNNNIGVDYSIEPVKELGIGHKIGITWKLGQGQSKDKKESQILYYKGIYYFTHDDYEEAILIWKRIPKSDSVYPKTQARIKEAEKILEYEKKQQDKLKKLEENFKDFQKMNKESNKK